MCCRGKSKKGIITLFAILSILLIALGGEKRGEIKPQEWQKIEPKIEGTLNLTDIRFLTQIYLSYDQYDRASQLIQKIHRKSEKLSDKRELSFLLAQTYEKQRKYDKASTVYQDIIESLSEESKALLEKRKQYEEGLKDIEGFSHLIVLFAFHKSEGFQLHTKPLLDETLRGVFSTRSPHRPNPIGMTVVNVIGRKGNILQVSGMDMIEGTPILDIKPYTTRDQKSPLKLGWLEDKMK